MGKALLDGADVAIFTSDNPRSEKPEQILVQMTLGLDIQEPSAVIEDRALAIKTAVNHAQTGDLVVILGKGHEKGQEIDGVVHPFDDRVELARAIEDKK
jgi:UDP-N-acetylmuramoyl-L-alanyl-D-glutamate--2,6-diaminopimelate ligase